eukprot:scaffold23640_cov132-Isochrysis_galbana.AAC.8
MLKPRLVGVVLSVVDDNGDVTASQLRLQRRKVVVQPTRVVVVRDKFGPISSELLLELREAHLS